MSCFVPGYVSLIIQKQKNEVKNVSVFKPKVIIHFLLNIYFELPL